MKNIFQILEKFDVTVPEDKQKDISKMVAEQYKPIAEVELLNNKIENLKEDKRVLQAKYDEDITKRDEDLKNLEDKLQNAGTDSEKLEETLKELASFKDKYEEDKKNYETQLEKQRYEFAVKEKVNGLEFTSNAAKKAFIQDVIEKELKLENDELLGFDDFVEQYKKEDEGVFVKKDDSDGDNEKDNQSQPKFSTKSNKNSDDESKDEGDSGATERPLIW